MANYEHMLSVDNQDMVPNMEEFECPVCFDTVKAGDGVILRECLHKFCRYVVTSESFKMYRYVLVLYVGKFHSKYCVHTVM